jgi:acetyltransferase-like isoleucine patch superfamily enzyme
MGMRSWLNSARNLLWKIRCPYIEMGEDVHIPWSVNIFAPHGILRLGNRVGINSRCTINTDLICGNHVLVAENVGFVARDSHTFRQVGTSIWDSPKGDKFRIVIEDDVWIGYGAIILSGVTIGRGAVIAAGAIITNDVPPYSIVVPERGRVLRQRFTPEEAAVHDQELTNQSVFTPRANSAPTSSD